MKIEKIATLGQSEETRVYLISDDNMLSEKDSNRVVLYYPELERNEKHPFKKLNLSSCTNYSYLTDWDEFNKFCSEVYITKQDFEELQDIILVELLTSKEQLDKSLKLKEWIVKIGTRQKDLTPKDI